MRLQDIDGYPDKLDTKDILDGNFSNEEIRDWAIDLLALEAECWVSYEIQDETTTKFALAIIASCRPIMEVMALNNGYECDQGVLSAAIAAHLNMSKALVEVKRSAIRLDIRDPE
jgi:hypothetical protein